MIAKAILRDGGLFIPHVQQAANLCQEQEVQVRFEILESGDEEGIFQQTAGLLKKQKIDPLTFQTDQRSEWDE